MGDLATTRKRRLPETVVDNCPETGEDKLSQFDLDLRPRN